MSFSFFLLLLNAWTFHWRVSVYSGEFLWFGDNARLVGLRTLRVRPFRLNSGQRANTIIIPSIGSLSEHGSVLWTLAVFSCTNYYTSIRRLKFSVSYNEDPYTRLNPHGHSFVPYGLIGLNGCPWFL